MQQLAAELANPKPRRNTVIKMCLRSQLSGVVKYITGAVDTLQVNDIFGQITHYSAPKLHVTSLDAVSNALWLLVLRQDIKDAPRLKDCSTDPAHRVEENTLLRDEIHKQMQADLDKKHRGVHHPFWHHTLACTVSSVETKPDL